MINVHASLLPKYRGAAPVHRAVIDGDAETGVTIMRMVARARRRRHARQGDATDRPRRDQRRRRARSRRPRRIAAARASSTISPRARAARNLRTTRCRPTRRRSRRKKGSSTGRCAADIHNRVRGLYPWPHAFSYLNGERLIVLRSHVAPEPTSADPGTIVDVSPARYLSPLARWTTRHRRSAARRTTGDEGA